MLGTERKPNLFRGLGVFLSTSMRWGLKSADCMQIFYTFYLLSPGCNTVYSSRSVVVPHCGEAADAYEGRLRGGAALAPTNYHDLNWGERHVRWSVRGRAAF